MAMIKKVLFISRSSGARVAMNNNGYFIDYFNFDSRCSHKNPEREKNIGNHGRKPVVIVGEATKP